MIDSLSDLQYATPDPIRFREFMYSLTQRLSRAGVSPIMTSEIPDLFHAGRLAEYGISHLSDNVILLQYQRATSRLLRTVTILKSRASVHDPAIREFEIAPDGIILGDLIGDQRVLGRDRARFARCVWTLGSPEWVAREDAHSSRQFRRATRSPHGADGDDRDLLEARDSCWRMSHTIHALQDTIVVLRAGANSLAIDNALLRIENERLRIAERSATPQRG